MGFLTIGTLGEQIKTRLEVRSEEKGARDITTQSSVELDSGVAYTDLRIGGGAQPRRGDLVVLDFRRASVYNPALLLPCLGSVRAAPQWQLRSMYC